MTRMISLFPMSHSSTQTDSPPFCPTDALVALVQSEVPHAPAHPRPYDLVARTRRTRIVSLIPKTGTNSRAPNLTGMASLRRRNAQTHRGSARLQR